MTPLPAATTLDTYFLEARSKLLDLAATLDRIDRGQGVTETAHDPRLEKIRQALDVLKGQAPGRAERVQRIFSLEYDPSWRTLTGTLTGERGA
jgi:hypothetical protein